MVPQQNQIGFYACIARSNAYRIWMQGVSRRPQYRWNLTWKSLVCANMKCFSWLVIKKACRTQEVLPKKGIQLVLTSQMLSLQQNSGNQLISVSSL